MEMFFYPLAENLIEKWQFTNRNRENDQIATTASDFAQFWPDQKGPV